MMVAIAVLFCGNSLLQASEIGYGKTLECIETNKGIATNLFKNIARDLNVNSTEMTLLWNADTEYAYTGYLYKTEYIITVKADSNCFPQSIEIKVRDN
jgi:hypothetical protein